MTEFTVIGFTDESEEAHVAGVIEGRHNVTQEHYDRWFLVVEADSPAQAEALALSKIEPQLEQDDEEEDEE
jgi:hypothetical protein